MRIKSLPAHVFRWAGVGGSPALAGIVITPGQSSVHDLPTNRARQKTVVREAMLDVRLGAPVLCLLEVHDPLHRLKIFGRDQRLRNYSDPDNFLRSSRYLSPVSLAAVDAGIPTVCRWITLFVNHPPAGPDRIAHDDVHAPRGDSNEFRETPIALVPREKLPECLPDALRF